MTKLFIDNKYILKYFKETILHENIELELLYGYHKKHNLTKKNFLDLLNCCKEHYIPLLSENTLDIRSQYVPQKLSNIRVTIHGIENIKRYCIDNLIDTIDDKEFIKKKYYQNSNEPRFKYISLIDKNYDIKLNIKHEEIIEDSDSQIKDLLNNFNEKKKHFRYKRRFSFQTQDNLFRIDLTSVKSTIQENGKYKLFKSFRESNVLNNNETYELEIEFIGNNTEIHLLSQRIKENQVLSKPENQFSGNYHNPLHLEIQKEPSLEKEKVPFISSPKYTEEELESGSDKISSIKYSETKYQELIGKYTKIKDEYFDDKEFTGSLKSKEILHQYYKKDIPIGIIKEIIEEIDTKKIKVRIEFSKEDLEDLIVPIQYLYGGHFIIRGDDLDSELSVSEDITGEVTDDLIQKLVNILEGHVFLLLRVIHNVTILLPNKKKNEILTYYKSLTNGPKKYLKFMGPDPVTLNHEHITFENNKSILINYAVTEKADGERYQLLIMNTRGYLINKTGNIIDTNINFPVDGGWIFDGEYITKNKENEDIQLFMIFDVYWAGNETPEPIYTYPFKSSDISRLSILHTFDTILKDIYNDGDPFLRIGIKEYLFGYESNDEIIDSKKISEKNYIKIFKSSNNIWKKRDSHYEYRIDGLIYIPLKFSVKAMSEGSQSKTINGRWYANYKWKPPEENTIDFRIKIKTELKHGNIQNVIIPKENEHGVLEKYNKLELFVGYDYKEDKTKDFCMEILEDKIIQKDVREILFSVDDFNSTNVLLQNDKLVCDNIEKSEIKDNMIVEMKFNPQSKNGTHWVPIRIRSDKPKPQFFLFANNIWETIQNPITTKMILGGYKDIQNYNVFEDKSKYYISHNEDYFSESYSLRKFHNYIKSKLIIGIGSSFKKKIQLLDLSSGRGGDILKYMDNDTNLKFMLGLDISSDISESCERYYFSNSPKPLAVFLRADTSKNIMNTQCSIIDDVDDQKNKKHTETMLSILYNNSNPIPKKYKKIQTKYKNLAKDGFDIISSQFSMHYYFQSQDSFQGFIQNLNDNIKLNGYFIGTCYNGQKIFEDLKSNPIFEYTDKTGNLLFKLEKKYDSNDFIYHKQDIENMFGNEIDVYMDSIGQTITEYLVNFDFFKDVMKENGFEIIIPDTISPKYSNIFRQDYFEDGLGQFENVIDKLPEIKQYDKLFQRKYEGAYDLYIHDSLKKLSSFNNYFIFQKVKLKGSEEPEESEKVGWGMSLSEIQKIEDENIEGW